MAAAAQLKNDLDVQMAGASSAGFEDLMGAKAMDVQFSEKNAFDGEYRNYADSKRQETVSRTYLEQHTLQTLEFNMQKRDEWLKFDKGEYTVEEVIEMLDELVDESDPDNDMPNSVHDFQTAERIREAWPEHDWFHLVGLLHDVGKFMALRGVPQWAVVGDTFPVGCAFSDDCVFPEHFEKNPDKQHPLYSTKYGIYNPNCGLDNLMMSWGHDEYMYWVLKENGCTLPKQGLDMIRYHSFYPWHDKGAYQHLTTEYDETVTKKWVNEFNRFDLYSKGDAVPDVKALMPYYRQLLEKYNISGKLRW